MRVTHPRSAKAACESCGDPFVGGDLRHPGLPELADAGVADPFTKGRV